MLSRTTLVVCMAMAAASLWSGASGTAQATPITGDFIFGCTNSYAGGPGTANDFEYDLGPLTAMYNGEQWSMGSLLTLSIASGDPAYAAGFNNVEWGVLAVAKVVTPDNPTGNVYKYYVTYLANSGGSGTGYNIADSAGNPSTTTVSTMYRTGLYNNLADTCITSGNYGNIQSGNSFSWTSGVATTSTSTGGLPNQILLSDPGYPATPASGSYSDVAYVCAFGGSSSNHGLFQQAFTFTFDSTGTLTYDTVPAPEPSTLALLGAGLFGLVCYTWHKRR